MSATHRLVITAGGPKRAAYLLADASIGIGRDADNVIQVEDNFVSRHHAVLVRNCDGYILRDLGSRNCTYVNDLPVLETALKPGDRLRCGGFEFQYEPIPAAELPGAGRLSELDREVTQLRSEAATAREQLAVAKESAAERLAQMEAARQAFASELAASRQQCDDHRRQSAETENNLRAQLAQAAADRNQLATELAATREALASIQPVTTRGGELEQTIARLAQELSVAQMEIAVAGRRWTERDREFTRWQSLVTEAARCARQVVAKFDGVTTRKISARDQQEFLVRFKRAIDRLVQAQHLPTGDRDMR